MEELFRVHWPLVFGYFARRVRDRHRAEDMAGEVYVRAVRSFGSWRGESPAAWLLAIAHNVLVDWARRKKLELVALAEADDFSVGSGTSSIDIDAALASLPAHDRRLLNLLHRYGFTVDEVAAMTDTTAASVRSAAYRARAAARQLLEDSHD